MSDPNVTVIGIDANSHKLALVWKRDGSKKPILKTFELTEGDSVKASGEAFRCLSEFFIKCCDDGIFDPNKTKVYMEAPIMGTGGPGATIPQAFVEGAVSAWAYEFSLPISLVNNQSWKKKVLGNGNISKTEVTRRMGEVWPELVAKCPIIFRKQWPGGDNNLPDQDLIDAGAVHLYGEWKVDLLHRILKRRNSVQGRKIRKIKIAV